MDALSSGTAFAPRTGTLAPCIVAQYVWPPHRHVLVRAQVGEGPKSSAERHRDTLSRANTPGQMGRPTTHRRTCFSHSVYGILESDRPALTTKHIMPSENPPEQLGFVEMRADLI